MLSSWEAEELMLSRREAGMKSRLERCWLMLPMFDHIMYQMPTVGAKDTHPIGPNGRFMMIQFQGALPIRMLNSMVKG